MTKIITGQHHLLKVFFFISVLGLFLTTGCVRSYLYPYIYPEHTEIVEKHPAPGTEESTPYPDQQKERLVSESTHTDEKTYPPADRQTGPTEEPSKEQKAGDLSGEKQEPPKIDSVPEEAKKPEKMKPPLPPKDQVEAKKPQNLLDESLDYCQVAQEFWQKGELESALEALDQAYELMLKADPMDDPKLIQQKEDIRFTISKRILEIYAARNIVVNGGYNAIPLDMNRWVESELRLFTKGAERKFFLYSYKRSGRYRPMIVRMLKEAGLPEELSWLPLIESGFTVKALSRARALGLWQFIPSTGYKFGLKRTLYVDERIDPVKSTTAAIAYLKELHNIFGDWATVLAAYNCGEGRVLREIKKQNLQYLDNFWDLFQRLPFETARYVPRFLATLHIVKNLEKYGLDKVEIDPPMEWETVGIEKQVHLKDIAEAIGVPYKTLKNLNPELRYDILPPEKYNLKVPPGISESALAKIEKVPERRIIRPSFVFHRIRPGETLSVIAKRYGVSIRSLAAANGITSKHMIIAGKKLKIPQKGLLLAGSGQPIKKPKTSSKSMIRYVVRSGDSLWNLARRYGTTVSEIQRINGLKGTALSINQVLNIPSSRPEKSKGSLKTYLVEKGDNPFSIAKKYNMSISRFLQINNLTSRSKIYPGQRVFIE